MKHKIAFWSYCLFILAIVLMADLDLLPLHLLMPIPHYDWAAHFILYGLFYRLLSAMLVGRQFVVRGKSIEAAWLITICFVVLEEVSQILFSSRTFSLMDLAMGILGMYLFRYMKRRKVIARSLLLVYTYFYGKTQPIHDRTDKKTYG